MPSIEQDALDRVSRMYSSFDRTRRPPQRREEPPPQRHEEPPEPQNERQPNLMELLTEDSERSLIMLLILLLLHDGADSTLILALMYIIL